MNQGADPERAPVPERGPVGFERAVLLGVALDPAPRIERAVVANGGKSPFDNAEAVVEDPLADPGTQRSPDQALERRAVEGLEVGQFRHLPDAFDSPEVRVIDGAEFWLH